jgi:drug/metabolite transporter (DMT)-like permease
MARSGVVSGLAAADIAVLRYGTAGLVLAPFLVRRGIGTLAGVGRVRGAVLALLAGPPFVLVGVGGYAFAPLAHGAVVQPAALTLGGTVLAMALLGDRPGRARLLGSAVMMAGLALIAGPGLFGTGARTLFGDGLFATAGLMWAGFTVLSRRWRVDPLAATAAVAVLSAAVYVPVHLLTEGVGRLAALPLPVLGAQVLVQGVLSGVVAVVAFGTAAKLLGAGRALVFPALVPAMATLIGIPITGEWPDALQLAGLAVVSSGLLIAARPG